LRLSQGLKLNQILSEMRMVAEGVETVQAAIALGMKHQVELPICEAVYSLLYQDKDPRQGVIELMTRSLKEEFPFK